MLLLVSLAACGDNSDGNTDAGGSGADADNRTTPTVLSNAPVNGATQVAINARASATFSEAMDPDSFTAGAFTLTGPAVVPVQGTVVYANSAAFFWPTGQLTADTMFTATITTQALSATGVPLAADHSWTFTTGDTVSIGLPVDLGTAGGFAILAKSAISTVPASAVTGNVGLSPSAATFITGFSLIMDATNVFSTSTQVTGQVFAADYTPPTPTNLTTAVANMETAFTDAAGRAPDVTELGAGNIGGMTLPAGVYKWGTGVLIPSDVTLNGNATDVWIFQIAQDLTMSSATSVHLTGGALPKNVFWQVAGFVEIGTTAHIEGIVMSQTAITLRTGASINGRLMAQTAVDIDASTVVQPAP